MRFPEFDLRDGHVEGRLRALRDRPLNFDPETLHDSGWEHDDYRQALPSEQPGPPEPGGSWETAATLSRNYAFADPSLVEARFDPDTPLEDRDMLLILHALGARIYAGVRVSGVGNETRTHDDRDAQVFFWNYRTLEGHVEAGQRDFEVWKWLDSGEVEFRTHAISRAAETNPIVQVGFAVLGRHKQVEFGERACKRMALLTEVNLDHPDGAGSPEILDGRMLALYLRDHHALLVAMGELANRMNAPARSDGQQAFAAQLGQAAADDRASVEELLRRLDSAPSQVRQAAAWSFEKVGRLKLNGRVVRPSPLAAVTELEGCKILLESDRALWSGLAQLAIGPADSDRRARRAEGLLAEAEGLRVDAFHGATHHRVDAVGQPR
ncbi:MAG TPA: DUF1990 family protein [Gaiellales bacterium]|nr:DUF1990 family protein [Gaiellales bacterium]